MHRCRLFLLGLVCSLSVLASAQQRAPVLQCADPLTKKPVAAVTGLELPADEQHRLRRSGVARLGDPITVWVCSLGQVLAKAERENQHVTLFLNGRDSHLLPEKIERDRGRLTFRLERLEENADLWRDLLRNPIFGPDPEISVSVGTGEQPLPVNRGADMTFTLDQMRLSGFGWSVIALLFVFLGVFIYLATKYTILRNGPNYLDAAGKSQAQPYSLSRFQMAWWFFLILYGYVAIWMISGERGTITPSLLALMGISAATALGSVAIGSTADARARDTRTRLTGERLALDASLTQVNALLDTTSTQARAGEPAALKNEFDLKQQQADLAARKSDIDRRLNLLDGPQPTQGFLKDVLSDESGAIVLHRFQIFVWTIVLGVVFCASVARDLHMPEFNATMLALMGISAGTYLGFKFPEANA